MTPSEAARALSAELVAVLKKHKATIHWKTEGNKAILTLTIQTPEISSFTSALPAESEIKHTD